MELITRDEAIARGLKRYFTGHPCKHGHVTERFVSGFLCYGCTDANAKRWLERNVERKRTVDEAYRVANRDELRAKANARYRESEAYRSSRKHAAAEYDKSHPEKAAERVKSWIASNPDARREHQRKWRFKNLGLVAFWSAMRRATVRKATPSWADPAAMQAIYERAAALTLETGIPHEVDHVYPLRSRLVCGLHTHDNLQVLTEFENRSKGNKMPRQ